MEWILEIDFFTNLIKNLKQKITITTTLYFFPRELHCVFIPNIFLACDFSRLHSTTPTLTNFAI